MSQCKCGGSFDEYGLCFECDKPEPKENRVARLNRERVQRHRDKKRETLVKVEVWIKPEHRLALDNFVKGLNGD